MAKNDTTTTIEAKVPACELQAISYSIFECTVYIADIARLMKAHADDEGKPDQICPTTLDHLADTVIRMTEKQSCLLEMLEAHTGISGMRCDRTFQNINDYAKGIISAEYRQQLEKAS